MSDEKKSEQESQVFELEGGDVRVWIEQEVVHLVAFAKPYHDPVELTAKMAKKLAAKLQEMAEKLDD
jgi:hypothetical protein